MTAQRVLTSAATRSVAAGEGFDHSLHLTASHPEPVRTPGQLSGLMMGHFLLGDVLGAGGMGAVYRALDTSLQRYVAVKVLNRVCTARNRQSSTAAIMREAVAQARLNHPNVVTIYYVGRGESEPFFAMELVPGKTLRDMLLQGPIDYAEAIRIAMQLVAALRHAAMINVVHGDIKPSNLLIDADGDIKLSDFGLARSTIDEQSSMPLSGTPAYMAPELILGGGVSVQSDMYAVGITIYEMVFGRLPFRVSTEGGLAEQLRIHQASQITYPDPWPRRLPIKLQEVLDRLLSKDPSARYATYDELAEALQEVRPVSTTVAGLASRAAAFAIDQLALLVLFLPFAIPIYISTLQSPPYAAYGRAIRPWNIPLAIAALIVPALCFLSVRRGWRTIGRWMFQLRVTERHGLLLQRDLLLLRAGLRNAAAWLLAIGLFGGLYFPLLDDLSFVVVLVILLAEILCAIVSPGRRSIHDWICHSLVVLDSDTRVPDLDEPSRVQRAEPPPSDPVDLAAAKTVTQHGESR